MRTITVLDCETGGLIFEQNPITELALLNYSPDNFIVNDEFQTFVKPYADLVIDPKSMGKSMVTLKDIDNGMPAKKLVKTLIELFKSFNPTGKKQHNTIICGHNVDFDIDFLVYLFLLHGEDIFDYISREKIDTQTKWLEMYPNEVKSNLSYICKKINYSLTGAHSAMNDVRATFFVNKYFVENMRKKGGKVKIEKDEKEPVKRYVFNF